MNAPGPTVLASGAWLKNSACLLDAAGPHWSALHGDLDGPQACCKLEASLRQLALAAGRPVDAVAHDLHPDFFSTRIARELAQEWCVPAIAVQHHHAHIAAVLAEHALDEPVVGLALDGVGLGTDGSAWGGELLRVDVHGFERLGSLWPLQLPGGDIAAREPWRMAASALHAAGQGKRIATRLAAAVGDNLARGVQRMLATGLNCPATTSAGRWFDAAAGALGLSVRQRHEAQAAMALEQAASQWLESHAVDVLADVQIVDSRLDLRPLLSPLFDVPASAPHVGAAAAWFHVSLAHALAGWAAGAAKGLGLRTICLGGGCFANRVLRDHLVEGLARRGLRVLLPQAKGCGDAGLALGQAWVVAQWLRRAPAASFPQEVPACV